MKKKGARRDFCMYTLWAYVSVLVHVFSRVGAGMDSYESQTWRNGSL